MDLRELQRHVLTLATLEESEAPVVSCYLDLGTGEYEALFRERVRLMRRTLPAGGQRKDLEAAVALIEECIASGLRNKSRGLVVFARGGARRFLLPLEFQVPVPNWIAVGPLPNIYHLVELKDTYHRYVVMLASGSSVRILGVNLGSITQDIWDRRPEFRQRVGQGWAREHYRSHNLHRADQFLREGVQVMERLMLAGGYRHLILAGDPKSTVRVRQILPETLAAMLVDIVPASAGDDVSDVVNATLLSFIEQEEQESLAMVDRLLEAISTDGLAAVGTSAVWEALRAGRTDVLILAKAYEPDAGWICPACEAAEVETAAPNRCPQCKSAEPSALDVKEAMVRCAERNGCPVEVVNHSEALLRLGGVGCLLRYLDPEARRPRAA